VNFSIINAVGTPEANRKREKCAFLPWFIDSAMYKTNTTNDFLVGNKLAQLLDFHMAVDRLEYILRNYMTRRSREMNCKRRNEKKYTYKTVYR